MDLEALADWLVAQGTKSAAMESTYVYWIPLYELLESRGIEPVLVNARQLHNVPGRKTDVSDCQWLQLLHSCGLLQGSFRPSEAISRLRALQRHMGTSSLSARAAYSGAEVAGPDECAGSSRGHRPHRQDRDGDRPRHRGRRA